MPNQVLDSSGSVLVQVGQNLQPFVGKKIQIIGIVSNTKYPAIGEYWITCFELEDYRNMKVHVWGIVREVKESSNGGYSQGRDGTYFHLKLLKVKVLEKK